MLITHIEESFEPSPVDQRCEIDRRSSTADVPDVQQPAVPGVGHAGQLICPLPIRQQLAFPHEHGHLPCAVLDGRDPDLLGKGPEQLSPLVAEIVGLLPSALGQTDLLVEAGDFRGQAVDVRDRLANLRIDPLALAIEIAKPIPCDPPLPVSE